jgi:hypothetical protein
MAMLTSHREQGYRMWRVAVTMAKNGVSTSVIIALYEVSTAEAQNHEM